MNPIVRFLLKILLLYLLWFLIYDQWLHPARTLDDWVIDNLASVSAFILRLFNYPVTTVTRGIFIEQNNGFSIGDNCNGINLIALFIGFIIAFPGNVWSKLIFCAIGSITIHLLNVIRVVVLLLIQYYIPEWLAFNHTYTFTFIVYGFIFLMWILWVNKFAKPRHVVG